MLNEVILMGRLTRDPDVRMTQNGTTAANFSLACERDYAPQGQDRETDFFDVVAFRNTADFVGRYFAKGSSWQSKAVCSSATGQTSRAINAARRRSLQTGAILPRSGRTEMFPAEASSRCRIRRRYLLPNPICRWGLVTSFRSEG